jgi:lysophospholipase L1-like esterase
MFGDSMVTSGLGIYLKERVVALGGSFVPVSKGASTTVSWTEGSDLQDLIARTRPDVVVVALTANELFVPNPRNRTNEIRAIVRRIGARPCLWIGPPPWRPEKGILGVVRENSTPCRFFDSSALVLERQADGIHPTLQGGKVWADAVWNAEFTAAD